MKKYIKLYLMHSTQKLKFSFQIPLHLLNF